MPEEQNVKQHGDRIHHRQDCDLSSRFEKSFGDRVETGVEPLDGPEIKRQRVVI